MKIDQEFILSKDISHLELSFSYLCFRNYIITVSYTHLTLPTNSLV